LLLLLPPQTRVGIIQAEEEAKAAKAAQGHETLIRTPDEKTT
jgi:hypothetical protein